jgi:NAD(P)-dependent dehydrogenase (short-subunit alcohol dehydrogenase family)
VTGKRVLLADLRQENADAAAKTLSEAGFNVTTAKVEVSSRASVQALVETREFDSLSDCRRTVSKNVSKGVVPVLVLVVAELACVANENGYF